MTRHKRQLQQLTIDGSVEVVAEVDLSPSWGGKRRGAGRPRTAEPSRVLALRLPASLYAELERSADRYGISPAAYLRELLTEDRGAAAERWLADDLRAAGAVDRLADLQ